MLAYHSDVKLRKSVINEMALHRKADELVQGYGYWKDGKGCAVGCLVKGNNHAEYETRFGIPQMLARLEDTIFEGLPKAKAQKWPERFLSAIKAGQDLSLVGWEFQHRLQINNLKFAKEQKFPEDVIKAIEMVVDVLEPRSKGKKVNESAARSASASASASAWAARSAWAAWATARSARSAARSASASARSAAWAAWAASASASESESAWAAWATARSASESESESESAWAAWATARSASARSARSASAYEEMADLLIEIIEAQQE